jgi:hypothetical protein
MGLDLDLQDGGVFGAADGREGLTAALTATLLGGQLVFFDDGGEVGVIPAARPRATALLAPRPGWGGRSGRGRGRGGTDLGLTAEELLLAETQLGAELVVLPSEQGFAFEGTLVQRFPVAGLTPGLEFDGESWADRTRAVGQRWCRADRAWGHGRQRHACRVGAARVSQRNSHANFCSPDQSAGQRS